MGTFNDRTALGMSWYNAATGKYDWHNALADTMVQTVGYDPRWGGSWHVPTFTTSLIATSIASKIVGRFVKPSTFDMIPYIGKKIKM